MGGACEMRKGSSVEGPAGEVQGRTWAGPVGGEQGLLEWCSLLGADSPVGSLRDLEAVGHQGIVLLAFSRATAQ